MLTEKVQPTEIQEPFVPLAVLEHAFRYWWVLAALIVLGGLGGLLAHSFNPPLYEATAEFSIAIDYVSTGPMTQYAEDLAINTAGHIFDSKDTLQILVDQANREGITINLAGIYDKVRLERRFSIWTLRVRDPDPSVAARIAEIWLREGGALLRQRYQHALQAQQLERYLQSQESYLAKLAARELFFEPGNAARFADIQGNLKEAGAALFQERLASQGMFAGLTLGPVNAPEVSSRPVTLNRNLYVALGGLLGMVVGIVLVELAAHKRLRTKR